MRVDYDPEAQAWYLTFSEVEVNRTVYVSDEVAVDVSGEPVGVEFLLAPAAIEPDVRAALFERFPVVRKALVELHEAVA